MNRLQKRLWSEVSTIGEAPAFAVALDGKPISTPAKAPLSLPTKALAKAVAAEWQRVQTVVDPTLMPLTRLANSTFDKIGTDRSGIVAMLSAYADTDLLCYRAAEPEALAIRQSEAWDPLLEWLRRRFGVRLASVTGVMYRAQSASNLQILHRTLQELDDFALMAVHDLVILSGSLVLGLAICERYLSCEEAWPLSRIDETWQAEQWGSDAEAVAAAETKRRDFAAAGRFLTLSRQ